MGGNAGSKNNSRSSGDVNNNGVPGSVGNASYAEAGSAAVGAASAFINFGDAVDRIVEALELKMAEAGLGTDQMGFGMMPNPQLEGIDPADYKFFGQPQMVEATSETVGLPSQVSSLEGQVTTLEGNVSSIRSEVKSAFNEAISRATTAQHDASEAQGMARRAMGVAKQALSKAGSSGNPAVDRSDAETANHVTSSGGGGNNK